MFSGSVFPECAAPFTGFKYLPARTVREGLQGVIENSGCQGTQMLSSDAMGSPRNDRKETF